MSSEPKPPDMPGGRRARAERERLALVMSEIAIKVAANADLRGFFEREFELLRKAEREECALRIEACQAAKGPGIVPAARAAFAEAANTCRAGWLTTRVPGPAAQTQPAAGRVRTEPKAFPSGLPPEPLDVRVGRELGSGLPDEIRGPIQRDLGKEEG